MVEMVEQEKKHENSDSEEFQDCLEDESEEINM
jgi:hypothetical protein